MSFLRFVFFCKQKTAYEMRISDWSSDVCSSDLARLSESGSGRQAREMIMRRLAVALTAGLLFRGQSRRVLERRAADGGSDLGFGPEGSIGRGGGAARALSGEVGGGEIGRAHV